MIEEWRDAPRYEGIYQVSSLGRVRTLRKSTPMIRKTYTRKRDGYETVGLTDTNGVQVTHKVHALVAAAFMPPTPPGFEIDHRNGVRNDNRFSNLRHLSIAKNRRNAHTARSATGEVGVYFSKNPSKPPYRVYVTVDYRKRFLGYFQTVEAASAARKNFVEGLI